MNFLQKIKPQFVFLFVALTWGTAMIFLTPPFQVPDEPAHFFRAYQLSSGRFFPEACSNNVGGILPNSLTKIYPPFLKLNMEKDHRIGINDLQNAFKIQLTPSETTFIGFPNTARVFPVPYFPQAIGIAAGRIFNARPIILLYLGRLVNLFVWITIVFFAIKNIPVHKWLFITLALLPMSIFEAASHSADAFTNGITFFGISLFLHYAIDHKKTIVLKEIMIMAMVVLLISLSKSIYILFVLMFFLIPKTKFESPKKHKFSTIIIMTFGITGLILSGVFAQSVYGLLDPDTPFFESLSVTLIDVDHVKQLSFIASHPVSYLKIMIQTFVEQGYFLIESYIGILGWLDTPLPRLYFITSLIFIFGVAFTEVSRNIMLSCKQKFILLLIFTGTIAGLATILYLTWTPVGQSIIDGLQGRYFIPVIPLFFLLFYNRKLLLPDWVFPIAVSAFVFTSFIVSTYTLHQRYWDFF